MNRILSFAVLTCLFAVSATAQKKQATVKTDIAANYVTVEGDPLKARCYTLSNGMKVYLSVYKDEPRFQSMIGVKAGSKTDPADATGLAHYLEHMLFKGTDKYGTRDYAQEKPLLDSIYNLYALYGNTKDSLHRLQIYDWIDKVSYQASEYAIPNEYDKMVSAMGATGTNAFTSVEQTVYIDDVPSNYVEPYLTLQAERFHNPVMRLFHTELEAVYEEKNRALDNDGRKVLESLYAGLFQYHPYGTQTTIGTVEHLKNPSLKRIQEYFDSYYVPNNMIISLSGDFNPDEVIKIIDKKFGNYKPKELPPFNFLSEKGIKQQIVKDVFGPDAESVTMGFRFSGANTAHADLLTMVDMILSNGQAGMLDLNLNQAQKVLTSSSYTNIMKDYSVHVLSGRARDGQTLEQVRDLLISQILEMKLGNFPDWILPAIINQLKLEQAQQFESNRGRASFMLNAEITGVKYKDAVNRIERLARINKQQIIDFVRTYYGDNFVIVYKHTDVDNETVKVIKPKITPVLVNRDVESPFLKSITGSKVKPIQPVFLDFTKDIRKAKLSSGIEVSYVQNKENNLFDLYYILDMGTNHNKKLGLATEYIEYIGTDKLSAAELKQEFYKLGCNYSVSRSEDQTSINLSGLNENFNAAVALLESFLANIKADDASLENLKNDILKRRVDAKLNKRVILSNMQTYARYGAQSSITNILSEQELKAVTSEELIALLKSLTGFEHRISYYGPAEITALQISLDKNHLVPAVKQPVPQPAKFTELSNEMDRVFVFNYDMKQAEIIMQSKGGLFDKQLVPSIALYNEYFGGSMGSIVFQTLRESKALAYSVSSTYRTPEDRYRSFYNYAYIGSQVDKLPEALAGLSELLNEMPLSESALNAAKESLIKTLQTERITKSDVLFTRDRYAKLGYDYDRRKDMYEKIPSLTLSSIQNFHEQYIKNRKYNIMVLGNREKLDFKALEKYGEVNEMGLENLFGY